MNKMDKKGALFATLTIIIMAGFVVGMSMNKERILRNTKIVETGKISEALLDFTLEEEKVGFFIGKAMEVGSHRALVGLGESAGMHEVPEKCGVVDKHIILGGDCYSYVSVQESFFKFFKKEFGDFISEYGSGSEVDKINVGWDFDEEGKFYLEADGDVVLSQAGINYGFELGERYYVDYDFDDYSRALMFASGCVEKESSKSIKNYLFEDCRKNKDFRWEIDLDEERKYVLFNASKTRGYGEVKIRFALAL